MKVTDFGIARAGTSDGLTQTGSVMGTATYFSPEQAQGLAVDGRSDVYSLGVVLYEMVTGVAPFTGDSPVAVAYKHVREEPVPPSQRNPDVPADLEQIIIDRAREGSRAPLPDRRRHARRPPALPARPAARGRAGHRDRRRGADAAAPHAVGAGVAAAATVRDPAVAAAGVDTRPPADEPPARTNRALVTDADRCSGSPRVVGRSSCSRPVKLGGEQATVTVPNVVRQDDRAGHRRRSRPTRPQGHDRQPRSARDVPDGTRHRPGSAARRQARRRAATSR